MYAVPFVFMFAYLWALVQAHKTHTHDLLSRGPRIGALLVGPIMFTNANILTHINHVGNSYGYAYHGLSIVQT